LRWDERIEFGLVLPGFAVSVTELFSALHLER
jgi:hypothetical protein